MLFIILFLHQTTTEQNEWNLAQCCLSSCSYIKPQLISGVNEVFLRCLSSCSYIKPQLYSVFCILCIVVYHLVPTSNHNLQNPAQNVERLFIILFLHQTTTKAMVLIHELLLFIILFLHQTTTISLFFFCILCCLSSCSYIKPQPIAVNLLVISKILRFELIRNGRAGRFLLQIY